MTATFDRRRLGRSLSRVANATVAETLAGIAAVSSRAQRIGVTGPPGAGKSTLIGRLVRHRICNEKTIGVVAVDPTSPYTHGAFLGDRIRMDQVADDPRLFIRSLASRSAHDGLADNIVDVLATLDGYSFDEVILETVGVGQAEYSVRMLVDTLVLVLTPESGDQVQAMKAGMLETADIYVVNKADLPGAERIASELRAVLHLRRRRDAAWNTPVILAGTKVDGLEELDDAVTRHFTFVRNTSDPKEVQRRRKEYHLTSLVRRTVLEILAETSDVIECDSLAASFATLIKRLKNRGEAETLRKLLDPPSFDP